MNVYSADARLAATRAGTATIKEAVMCFLDLTTLGTSDGHRIKQHINRHGFNTRRARTWFKEEMNVDISGNEELQARIADAIDFLEQSWAQTESYVDPSVSEEERKKNHSVLWSTHPHMMFMQSGTKERDRTAA